MYEYDEVTSTSDIARGLLTQASGVVRTCVVARAQSAGRGASGSVWVSEPGGLWATCVVPQRAEGPPLQMWAAVGVAETIREVLGGDHAPRVTLKWPNDVLVDGKKIAGTLVETVYGSDQAHYGVVGIGVNVNQRDMPGLLGRSATTLWAVSGHKHDTGGLLETLLGKLNTLCADDGSVLNRWLSTWGDRDGQVLIGKEREPMIASGVTTRGAMVCTSPHRPGVFRVVYSTQETRVEYARNGMPA